MKWQRNIYSVYTLSSNTQHKKSVTKKADQSLARIDFSKSSQLRERYGC